MGTTWRFVRKTRADGTLDKFKGRVVVQGFTSIPGVHHSETFAPTASGTAARTLFAVAAREDWDIDQMDVTGAFLYGDLQETVYCYPPPGFSDPTGHGRVWLLKKALYGLKQAPRCWITMLRRTLLQHGFTQSTVEPSLFSFSRNRDTLFLLVFVDDFLLTSGSRRLIDDAKRILLQQFDMTDLGAAEKYLGWHITRDRAAGKLWLTLEERISRTVTAFGQHLHTPTSAPLPCDWTAFLPHEMDTTNPDRRPEDGSRDAFSPRLLPDDHQHYRQGVGFINYAACSIRPDAAFAAGQLSLVLHAPRQRHYKAMLHCLRYLWGTRDLGLCFTKRSTPQMIAYSDSDFAGCKGTRRSVSGGLLQLADAPIHWCSKKQDCVTLSATEAEYVAMSSCARDILWTRHLLEEFLARQDRPTPLLVDNRGAVCLSKNPIVSDKSRHIGVAMHFVREQQVQAGTITVIHRGANGQVADFLTKSLRRPQLRRNLELAGLRFRPDTPIRLFPLTTTVTLDTVNLACPPPLTRSAAGATGLTDSLWLQYISRPCSSAL